MAALIPGYLPPITFDRQGYERHFALWLCRAEIMSQAEWVVYVGTSYAMGLDDLPAELFLAAFGDEASAFEAMVRTNNARSSARMARQRQARPGVQTRSLF